MGSRCAIDCRIDASENTTVRIAFSLINFKLVPAAAIAGRSDSDPGCACVRASMSFPCAAASGPLLNLPSAGCTVLPCIRNARVDSVR